MEAYSGKNWEEVFYPLCWKNIICKAEGSLKCCPLWVRTAGPWQDQKSITEHTEKSVNFGRKTTLVCLLNTLLVWASKSVRKYRHGCWSTRGALQRRGVAVHLSQLWRKGPWIIALSPDLPQLTVYSYGRVLGRLGCNCLFIYLSLQSALQLPRARGRLCSNPFQGPDKILAQRRPGEAF